MSNSPLVSYTRLSPNRTVPRNHAIDTITIHCTAGKCTAVSLGAQFAQPARRASSNYGVGYDGSIGMYCPESDKSWCSSNVPNDHRAVTIEVSSEAVHPYKVNDAAYSALLDLVTDICRRNGKSRLIWFGDKARTLAYAPRAGEMVMTVHRWFANKACPGDYLYSLHPQIAEEVNRRLAGETEETEMSNLEIQKLIDERVSAALSGAREEILAEVRKMIPQEKVYNTLEEIPEDWPLAREAVQEAVDLGALQGTGNGLGLTQTMLRLIVIDYRRRRAEEMGMD